MTTLKFVLATGLGGALLAAAAPAGAVITTFADYSGVGGANLYWSRTGSNYTPATTASVIASHVVALPHYLPVTGTPAQRAAATAANAILLANYNAAVAAQIPIQTAASAAAAEATAGGNLYTISTPTSKVPGAVATKFTFLTPTPTNNLHYLADLGTLKASFSYSASAAPGNPAIAAAGYDIQPLTSGSFSFTYTGTADLHVGDAVYHTGANLLSATFTLGGIVGQNHSTSGSVGTSTGSGGTIVYTSDFLNFIATNAKDYAIEGTSITPALGFTPNQALNSFRATTTGSFSTDPAPAVVAIPEPGMWLMMVAGFGLIGASTRRRGRIVAA